MTENPITEASHAELNPAYYPRDLKPEALWTEAEKSGEAEGPNDITAPNAPGTDENVELPEEFSDEAAQQRQAEVEEMAKKDIAEAEEKGEEPKVIKPEPQTQQDKVRRRRQS